MDDNYISRYSKAIKVDSIVAYFNRHELIDSLDDDQKEFVKLSTEHYQRVMNRWHQEHEELKRIRKI